MSTGETRLVDESYGYVDRTSEVEDSEVPTGAPHRHEPSAIQIIGVTALSLTSAVLLYTLPEPPKKSGTAEVRQGTDSAGQDSLSVESEATDHRQRFVDDAQ